MVNRILAQALRLKRTGIVFAGHGVASSYQSRFVEEVHIPFEDFKAVISTLEDLEFDFLSMEQVIGLSKTGFRHNKHWVHLTFDDGYQNNFDLLYPYLKSKQIPFTVFVSTYNIETADRFPTFWVRLAYELKRDLNQALGWPSGEMKENREYQKRVNFASPSDHEKYIDNLRAMIAPSEVAKYYNDKPISLADLKTMAADPLVHIGSHSHKHILFHPKQDIATMKYNLQHSREVLKSNWSVEADPTFCYPNGDHDNETAKLTEAAGFPMSFTSKSGFIDTNTKAQLMPRFWLSNPRRTLQICTLSLLGNSGLKLVGR